MEMLTVTVITMVLVSAAVRGGDVGFDPTV
jgi:hypothetical protein